MHSFDSSRVRLRHFVPTDIFFKRSDWNRSNFKGENEIKLNTNWWYFALLEQNRFCGYVLWRQQRQQNVIAECQFQRIEGETAKWKERKRYAICVWIQLFFINIYFNAFGLTHSFNVHVRSTISFRFVLWFRLTLISLSVVLWIWLWFFGRCGSRRILAHVGILTRRCRSIPFLRWLLFHPKRGFILRELISEWSERMESD